MTETLSLEDVARDFALANPKWARMSGAGGACYPASSRFQMYISEGPEGLPATLIEVFWGVGPWGMPLPEDRGFSDYKSHVAVLVGDTTVIDLTARQFDATLPFPWVCSRLEWEAFFIDRLHATPAITTLEAPAQAVR